MNEINNEYVEPDTPWVDAVWRIDHPNFPTDPRVADELQSKEEEK